MANKDLFKQAIAEAKSVREAAIANAKQSLEESLTPHLKDMLAAKLQELEGSEEEVKAEEGLVAESDLGFSEAAEDDSEESEDDAAAADAPEGEAAPEEEGEADEDKEVSDLSVEDFKTLIRDIIAQEMGAGAPEGEQIPGEEMPGAEGDLEAPAADVADSEEIDLEELLKELEGMGATAPEAGAPAPEEEGMSKEAQIAELERQIAELKGQEEEAPVMEAPKKEEEDNSSMMNEALETIQSLKKDLTEVNLLNAKLLYLNKVLKANNLSETQQVNVIAAFDKAETVKEVKLVFETICESLVIKKETNPIKESRGFASKATGTTASNPGVINEVSETVRRMQKLAGII